MTRNFKKKCLAAAEIVSYSELRVNRVFTLAGFEAIFK